MEALFLRCNDAMDQLGVRADLRIDVTHLVDDGIDELSEECTFDADEMSIARSSAEKATQHIASAFVTRQDTIGNHERKSPAVVS